MNTCPAPTQFEHLLREELDGAERASVEAHVETCARCQEALQRLADAGLCPFGRSATGASDPAPGEAVVLSDHEEAFLAQMGDQPPAPSATEEPAAGDAETTGWPTVPGYDILGELGRGGMGVVYQARQVALNRLVALKMIAGAHHTQPEDLLRFRIEAELLARLDHPHIVQVYEVGTHAAQPYFALEFVDGGSLADRLDGTPQPPRPAAELVEVLARAVHTAHLRGIVHRDLKPANVLLATPRDEEESSDPGHWRTAYGIPKIADFGLAKQLDSNVRLTQSGSLMGTPCYMAPEQCRGASREIGPATDVYALGTLLYELLTGQVPFRAEGVMALLRRVAEEEPPPPTRLRPSLPRDLEAICLKCLRKEPNQRYASAEALADDLQRFLNGEPIRARPVGSVERAWRWCRRNPMKAGLLAAVVVLLLGVAASSRVAQSQAEARAEAEARSLREMTAILYRERIALAERECSANNMRRVDQLLDACPQELRGWEWHSLRRMRYGQTLVLPGTAGDRLTTVAFSPDGRHLASASIEGPVRIWDLATGREVRTLPGHDKRPTWTLAFSPDGRRLATGGGDRAIKLWDLATGVEQRKLTGHASPVRGVAISPDGRRLASGGEDQTVRIWDLATGQELHALRLPEGQPLFSVAVSPDGLSLAAGSKSGLVHVWELATGRAVAFSPQGQRLAACGHDGTTRLWDATPLDQVPVQEIHTFPRAATAYKAVAFSPDGRCLAAGTHGGKVTVWDRTTKKQLFDLSSPGSEARVMGLSFRAGGDRLFSIQDNAVLAEWDLTTGRQTRTLTLRGHVRILEQAAFSPDGCRLATASRDGTTRVWDLATGECLFQLPGRTSWVHAVAYSPDSRQLVTGNADGTVQVWDAVTGRELRTLKVHDLEVDGLAFSPDGKRFATAGADQLAKVWDAASGQMLALLRGHTDCIRSVAFSPEGQFLATAGDDETVRCWDARSGQELRTWRGHTTLIQCVAFSSDGRCLASGGQDGMVKLWDTASMKGGQEP